MAKDIEEFLRMAAARRRASQTTPPPKTTRPPRQRRPAPQPELVEEEEIEIVAPKRESIAKHVQKHIDTSRLAKHAAKLGEKVGRVDDVVEARLHQKFDHQVGKLSSKSATLEPSEPADQEMAPSSAAQALIRSLATPQGMQQAIIINEVLKRPEWD